MSQVNAQHTAITKKSSKYLRKTLYQIILSIIKTTKFLRNIISLRFLNVRIIAVHKIIILENFLELFIIY